MSIAVIGTGNIGRAIIKKIKGKYKVLASDIDKNKLKGLRVSTTVDNKKAAKDTDIVIISVKPQNIDLVLEDIKSAVNPAKLIVSIAAGVTTKKIENKLGKIPVVRVMPNTPLLVGMGMTALCPGRYAGLRHIKKVKKIFSAMGKVIFIEKEKLMDAVTAVSGSGPAYICLFIESLAKSAMDLGLDKKTASALVLQTMRGTMALMDKTRKSPEELRRQVTSPGGTTEAALKIFEKKEFVKLVNEAITSAHKRSRELSR